MTEKQTILVIEDHEPLRKLMTGILKNEFNVITKKNGLEGMAFLASGEIPDLILADMNMPSMDGVTFIKNLKCSGFYRNIPVFVVSGNDENETRKQCYHLGVKQIFGKPFKPGILRKKIKEELQAVVL